MSVPVVLHHGRQVQRSDHEDVSSGSRTIESARPTFRRSTVLGQPSRRAPLDSPRYGEIVKVVPGHSTAELGVDQLHHGV